MSRSNHHDQSKGFTLVEMLVVAPAALLIIAGFIALMVTMVGDVLVSHERNVMTHDVQEALDMIERDVRLSTMFLDTTGPMPSPQGEDGGTAAFSSSSTDLILGQIATDKNPSDPLRKFVYYNTPFSCSDATQQYKNRIFFTTVIYFGKNGSLWRRTFVPSPSGTLCDQPWQVNTCAPGYTSAATQCKTNDTEVLKNVNSMGLVWLNDSENSVGAGNIPLATRIKVGLNARKTVAGRTVTTPMVWNISAKLTDKDIRLAPPNAPTVTAQAYNPSEPNTGTFTWTADPTVTYSIRYNINGGAWITAAESTKQSSIKLSASRNDTITVQVAARNTTGSSGYGAGASLTLPGWDDCSLQNGWVNYNLGYTTCGYTMTKHGVVVLKGLIGGGTLTSGTVLFRLPAGLRPSSRLIFQTNIAVNQPSRIDIDTSGNVILIGTYSDNSYVSVDGITFVPSQSLYQWTGMTPINGWTNYGSPYSPLQSLIDASGRVHIQGLLSQGTYTFGTPIAQLPSGSAPSEYLHLPARGTAYNIMGIDSSGQILARGINSSYYSTQAMFYPASYSGWQNFTYVSGNPADGQMGNGWIAYGGAYATPQYTKSADGIVTVKGLIKGGVTTKNTLVAKLPPGYQPLKTLEIAVVSSGGHARFDVTENGYIQAVVVDAGWTSISGISFVAEH